MLIREREKFVMKRFNFQLASMLGTLCFLAGVGHADTAMAQAAAGGIDISQQPLFTQSAQPPLNMLVMGKDHKIYYEAYNDASDLNGDGALDVGYKPASIDYYGYFNSNVCYTYADGRFAPASPATNKQCAGMWSGDFLNYLTTSRMDALRRVLYGGWRQVDTATETVLQGAFFPQDGHSWGKEYQGIARDGYDVTKYSPLAMPGTGKYHLFAVTTVTGNANAYPNYQAPLLRVLKNTDKRVWNWVSIEGPVAGNKCFTSSNTKTDCVTAGSTTWEVLPSSWFSGLTIKTWKRTSGSGSPADAAAMNILFSLNAINANLCGSATVGNIDRTGSNNNPFVPGAHSCGHDNYLTEIAGQLVVPSSGTYHIGIDGDDAVEVSIDGTRIVGWYGGHGSDRTDGGLDSHSADVLLTAGSHTIRFRHQEGSGGDNWGLFQRITTGSVTRDDYQVRVLSCPAGDGNAALRESICKEYPNDGFKPTGILHDYGEDQRMFFGLITGSQFNNLEGGVLRRNIGSFAEEIDSETGQFEADVDGIVNAISSLRMIGGGYNGSTVDNMASDTNWNWANGTGSCPSVGNRAINNGECRMWGNPLAEMLYESLRYFAGAGAPLSRFESATNAGNGEETTMGLHLETWRDPYAASDTGGGGFLECSRPFQTVISDINPSYDGDLPGSAFDGAVTTINDTPDTIASFDAATEGQVIWNSEFGSSRDIFIGDVAGATDGAPTKKTASSFGNIRGLSPEEPTKGGTYYSASVARYGRITDINEVAGQQNLSTYSVALASPLPRIEFPTGAGKITLLPFAKTASGTFGDGARKPTNTIVDFYVEKIVNLPEQPFDVTVNGGRPYAVFRINYEDVEQGNDHDMDAIVRYEIKAEADGTVTVKLTSEYAAGSADQNIGYVLSGTTQDGVYLEVRDSDSNIDAYYALNTPNPLLPGDCAGGAATAPAACSLRLPLESTRVFTPAAGAGDALQLNDPLWYAAKYGAPDPVANDTDNDGVPDNYFLVTNPANLRTQLNEAFTDILEHSQPAASVATSSPRYVANSTLVYEASYKSEDWTGDLKAFHLRADATYVGARPVWAASEHIPAPPARNVFIGKRDADGVAEGVEFTTAGLEADMETRLLGTLDSDVYDIDDLVDYLRGEQSMEQGGASCTTLASCPYRQRDSKIGDILNSTPAVVGVGSFGYGSILRDVASNEAESYPAFVESKEVVYGPNSEHPVIYVGANDGMLHAIDGREGIGGGEELFAYVPDGVLDSLHELARPGYIHRYYVDGSPTVSDAYLGSWKTILAGSLGAGGRGVYVLDITDPRDFAAEDALWEFSSRDDVDMGQFVGRPYIGRAESGWVAVFGNGYNSASQRAVLYIRDLATGSEIAKFDTGVGCATTEDGCTTGPNGLATAVLVDNDGNGAGDTVYAGDYLGNLWRFEYSAGAWRIGNDGLPLFKATDPEGKPQSLTSGVYTVANPLGGTIVIFGSGRYLNADDADEERIGLGTRAAMDSVYGIWDSRMCRDVPEEDLDPLTCQAWTDSLAIAGRVGPNYDDLEKQWISDYTPLSGDGSGGYREATRNPVDYRTPDTPGGRLGWWIDLTCTGCRTDADDPDPLAGERVIATPQGILSDVVFNTFRPRGDACEPGGLNATMVLDTLTGAASFIPVAPSGGWPSGQEPPVGSLIGTDTGGGAPGGEPPIVIIRPPNLAVECDPTDPTCVTPPECDPDVEECEEVTTCSWRAPNAAGRPPGKPIPCGRISWKQLR